MNARVISNMPADKYNAHPALRASELRDAYESALHWQHWKTHKKPTTAAMRLGSLAHTALLEPEEWARHVAAEKHDRRKKEGKAAASAVETQCAAEGLIAVAADEHAKAENIADAVRRYRANERVTFGEWLPTAERELTILWTGADGIDRKARLDAYGGGVIVDIKTTQDARERAFARTISECGYHIQAAHYRAACEAAGLPFVGFVFVAVETSPPHAVAAYQLDEANIDRGARDGAAALEMINRVRRTGIAESYHTGIAALRVPWLVD